MARRRATSARRRGRAYRVFPSGPTGLYVGTTPDGEPIYSLKGAAEFAQMCVDFDSQYPNATATTRKLRKTAGEKAA